MDTNARDRILQRIRSQQRRPEALRPSEEREAQQWLVARERGPLPAIGANPVAHFVHMAQKMSSTVEHIADRSQAPAALLRYLQAAGLPRRGVCYPALAALDWAGAGIALEPRAPRDEDLLSVTGCFCAVAETGSLVFASAPGSPAAMHLLPETHVVLVEADRVVAHQEDAFALMRRELGQIPRGFNTVSGPSRTGDIEQTIVLGAHGPYRVHVLVVGADN